jgi:hypothetical protein
MGGCGDEDVWVRGRGRAGAGTRRGGRRTRARGPPVEGPAMGDRRRRAGTRTGGAKGGDGGGQGFHAEAGPDGLGERNMLFYLRFFQHRISTLKNKIVTTYYIIVSR